MKISTAHGNVSGGYDALAICLFDDEVKGARFEGLDRATAEEFMKLSVAAKFSGKKGETIVHHAEHASSPLIILQGLGSRKHFTWMTMRYAAGSCVRAAQAKGARTLAITSENKYVHDLDVDDVMRALADGIILGAWKFDHYKSKSSEKPRPELSAVTVYFASEARKRAADVSKKQFVVMAHCTNLAREWGTHPTNVATIDYMTKQARALSKKGLKVSSVEVPEMKRLGMNLFVAVGQASEIKPRLVIMDYNPRGAKKTYALVGKGMVFDTGGLNIKTSMMEEMKSDMCGSAAVLGAMYGIAELKPKVRVIGLLALCENSIAGNAYRPSDIYTAMNGKTVEIGNTDAEGRLVLADSMCYANKKYSLTGMIDVATLTGAAVVALGHHADAVFTNNDRLQSDILQAATRSGERMWPLPNYDEYIDDMKSPVADLNNAAGHRWGGACTAAAFLKEFVGDTPWVHIDIAPTSIDSPPSSILPKAVANGAGVRTLIEFVMGK